MKLQDRSSQGGVSPSDQHLATAVRRLVSQFAPLQIIVFGSYARGSAERGSDLDLLVVLRSVNDARKQAVSLRRALADLPVSKDIVVASPEDISRRKESLWHILGQAVREGTIVYEAGKRNCVRD